MCVCVGHSVLSSLFATPWTIAHQAPLSMGFSRQEYWSGLPFPSPFAMPQSSGFAHVYHPTVLDPSLLPRINLVYHNWKYHYLHLSAFLQSLQSQWIIWHHRPWWIVSDHMPWKTRIPQHSQRLYRRHSGLSTEAPCHQQLWLQVKTWKAAKKTSPFSLYTGSTGVITLISRAGSELAKGMLSSSFFDLCFLWGQLIYSAFLIIFALSTSCFFWNQTKLNPSVLTSLG